MKVLVTTKLPGSPEQLLKKNGFDVYLYEGKENLSRKELLKLSRDADGILCLLSEKIDKEVIDNFQKCKVVANYAVGYNNIDIGYAKEKNIVVTNTPDVLTDATADIAVSLILACARRIGEGERLMRGKKFKGWKPDMLLGQDLKGKVVGIIGAGRIGSTVAKRMSGFDTSIIYYSRSRNEKLEKEFNAKKVSLSRLMKKADIISIHIPLNPSTKNLIDESKLSLMKSNAILVNTARGEVIDEKYLIKMLQGNKIFAAGFDVYEGEPAVNPELYKLENVFLLPHIGSATIETRSAMSKLAAQNIINVLKGKKALTPVT